MRRIKKLGTEFKPKELYTHRIRKILEEYPDGSQVLREILQNSDDSKSTEQIFILDHNTYPSDKLLEPHMFNNYQRTNLKLDRYQGPSLLARNNTIFEERDFQSLSKLADSEKRDQFDKIGVMGVGFNSVYHITDSPSFITGDKYVILDPHERYFNGGVKFDFVEDKLAEEYPDQFAPFKISCDEPFKGTIFRYPLRTNEDSIDSDISKKIYKPEEILDMFHRFYENEGINCLLFLKYIERIYFYELKEGSDEPELLCKIQLKNADQVREKRRLIAEKIIPMMNSLNVSELNSNIQLETSYIASFYRQRGNSTETSKWLILNYLDDLIETEIYFHEKFGKNIGDYKFIPNVGLAVPLNDLNVTGRLFCFLPLPISMPFMISVHGYFAVSTNRRSLWSTADNEYLATDGLARLKIAWNEYLFKKVLPKAWVRFLRVVSYEVHNIELEELHKFWPIVKEGESGGHLSSFCKDLLQNVVENLSVEDCIFKGHNSSNAIEPWLSIFNDYFDDKSLSIDLLKTIGNIGLPVISTLPPVIRALKNSRHKDSLGLLSPFIVRYHLGENRDGWDDNAISRNEVLKLFDYVLSDEMFDELEGFKMIPLADGTLGTLTTQSNNSYVYIDDITNRSDRRNIFKNQLNSEKLIDRSINLGLYKRIYNHAKSGWNLNIKILDEIGIKDLILIIKNMIKGNENKVLSIDEIDNVIEILERIVKIQRDTKKKGNKPEILDGLLIPSTKNVLVKLQEIYFNDMEDRIDEEEKSKYVIAHKLVNSYIAKELAIQTLTGKIYGINYARDGYIDWEVYEQNESLTTRIKNIVGDYPESQLLREFLQNADDAKATCISVTVDERQNTNSRNHLLSEEMGDWQGSAIWIYNDAEFSNDDFQALIKLGIGGKSNDDAKIGKRGIGFNCAFNITDLPSIVSGKYIAFLDPHAQFLPAIEYPPRRRKGVRINFIEKGFKRSFPDQCYPYEVMGCDFTKEFKGTLFRLPFRNHKSAEKSKISNRVFDINEILKQFNSIQGNKEMLFLKNVELCSLYHMKEQDNQLIWRAEISISDTCRRSRQQRGVNTQVYQMGIEITNNVSGRKASEVWLLCTGEHSITKPEFYNFAKEKRLKPRGGVASLLARSDKESLDELRARPFPNPPKLKGEIFSYLPLSISTNLGVHLNGDFTLSSARNSILQSDKWNLYIMNDILPDLHVNLLEEIAILEKARREKESDRSKFIPHILNSLWPVNINVNKLYMDYCSNVMKKLAHGNYRVFWTDANGGRFISIKEGQILEEEETLVVGFLVNLGIPILKFDAIKLGQLKDIKEFPCKPMSGRLVCQELQKRRDEITNINVFDCDILFRLLSLILKDNDSFGILTGLPLVPLNDGSIGKFGEVYYVGRQEHLGLFPNMSSKFVFMDLPKNLSSIFQHHKFSLHTNIRKFNYSAIFDLLKHTLPFDDEVEWNPNGRSMPNYTWLERILSELVNVPKKNRIKLFDFPLLPVIYPLNMLVKPNINNPLLYKPEKVGQNGYSLFQILIKLKVRFTNMILPKRISENLKKCIVECNLINGINSLEMTRSSLNLTMAQLFKTANLTDDDYKTFRALLKMEFQNLIKRTGLTKIVSSLPVWPTYSRKEFIDARSGKLLYNFPFFPFHPSDNFYKCDDNIDFNILTGLGANPINGLEYVEQYMIPYLESLPEPTQEYTNFLMNVLSLNNLQIEQRLRSCKAIPNKLFSTYSRASDLYDENNPIFRNVLTDKCFLPLKLKDSIVHLKALERMGLNYQMDCNTYIKCAREIELQIQNLSTNVLVRARILVCYLYKNIEDLNFNNEQWKEILKIKFVPSKMNLLDQIYRKPKETMGFETFGSLCTPVYKNVCWTQRPLFDEHVEPTAVFINRHPEIGIPSQKDIINHWFFIVKNLSSWKSSGSDKNLKIVIEEIYKVLSILLQEESLVVPINDKKLFLNGDDLFDEESWVSGKDLVLGLQDVNEGMRRVKESLMPYKNLLILAGARELNISPVPNVETHGQKDVLLNSLLHKLVNEPGNKWHDVIFIIEGKVRLSANRYVLSAASKYFERTFDNGTIVDVPEDINLDTFRVFLQWLYGQSFEDATKSILLKPEDFQADQGDYETYYLSFLINLLKAADIYDVKLLKNEIENVIMRGQYISIRNLYKILLCSEEYNSQRLKSYYENHIRLNSEFVEEELCKNVVNDDERSKISSLLY